MPKVPYKPEKSPDDDDDYEIVSFEDFCDKSPSSKTDLLTLNDNINYRLCYETDKTSKFIGNEGGTSSIDEERQTETSLNGPKNVTFKRRLSGSFAPFGRHNGKPGRGSLFSGVIPKPKNEGESTSREQHRYQRFSESRSFFQRVWDNMTGLGSGVLAVALLCALCVGAWWAVCGTVGGAWGEEQYRKLWERAHPDTVKTSSPLPYDKILPEFRYHDHNNLSTKNKLNATETTKKKTELNKKSYLDITPEQLQEMCGMVEESMRFDCYPNEGSTQDLCEKRGCCWKPATTQGPPYCYYPSQYNTYRFMNMTENKHGMNVYYTRARPSSYPGDFDTVRIDFKYLSDEVLQIKIYDAENKRFEVPVPDIPMVPGPISNLSYRVQLGASYIGFKVIRNSDNITIINTDDVGAMILSDRFLQMSTVIPTDHVFGFGEHRSRFMRDMDWRTYTMFNRDIAPIDNMNLYGTQPFYLAVERDGNSHGMLLLNSNAMDVVLQPTPAITYRTIGGIFNFLLFLGPTPTDVVQQYTSIVGRPFMPPYWSLGFHLCKFGYRNLNTTQNVWKTNRDAGIPFDVQWNDIDYMVTQNDFTYDTQRFAGLPQFVRTLHAEGMHYMIIIDPGVSAAEKPGTYPPFDRGIEMDVFIKNSTNQPFVAKVWNPVSTVFPDFTHPNSTGYWLEMMTEFHKKVEYDGAWIDMNEPSNDVSGQLHRKCDPENLPYKPAFISSEGLNVKTLCMDARHHMGSHYDVHNFYSLAEAIATHFALTEIRGKRPFIISRASFPGLGRYSGHWSGDIFSTWDDMRMTIPDLLSFSMFGVPMMGSDICGFNGNTSVELCKRWMQLGAFYPFSRNHNEINAVPQDPVSLGPEVVAASRRALRLRYKMLPYYYTLFWRAHVYGDTVARPLFFEFPDNPRLHAIDSQFLVGPHVMVTPILSSGASHARALFPGPHKWYNLRDGLFICSDKACDVTDDEMVSVKGGAIIPLQEPPVVGPVTTTNSRSGPMQILVVPANDGKASGELYWDDGDSLNSYEERKYSHIEFSLRRQELRSAVNWWGYGVPSLNNVTILDQNAVKTVLVNGVKCEKPRCDFTYIPYTRILHIHTTLSLDKPFNIKWTYNTQIPTINKVFRPRNNAVDPLNRFPKAKVDVTNNISCKNNDCSEHD